MVRDEHGIPQLYADSLDDLMMAQGYVQAQERFFEMDLRRHVTAGRLSELFGEETLETDQVIRTMGWRRVAERELALIEPRTRQALEAYADGVNAYLAERGTSELAAEYSLLRLGGLDYTPEDWTPVDSLAWLKAMAWDLRGNMEDEIGRVLAGVDHTDAEVAQLYPPYPFDEHPPIVAGGAVVDGVFDQDATGGTRNPERPPAAYGAAAGRGSATRSRTCRAWSGAATGSAATPGWSGRSGPRPAGRCWPTTRTSASRCPGSGCRWGCTAARSPRSARWTSRASPSPGSRA